MKLLVVGATGSIGRHLLAQGIEQNHDVTAFCRDASGLDPALEDVDIVTGDVLDPTAVDRAVDGQDAVMVALGAGAMGSIRQSGTRCVVRAMQANDVHRLICLSTLGVGDSRANLNFVWKHLMFGLLLRRAFADHVEQERIVAASGLAWTIVRPAAYTDGPLTGTYRHGFDGRVRSLELKISRADVAHFMLEQLSDDRYRLQSPGLSY